jgi:pilus assembly protein CpaE
MTTIELKTAKARAADFVAFVADKDTEQALRNFIVEEAMPHAHIGVGSIDDAIAHLRKMDRSPLFLLVDLSGSAMPLSDLGRLSEVCEPSLQVIAIGERNDVGLFRSLLKLGICDYLVKPLTVELLKRTINVAQGTVTEVGTTRVGKPIAFVGTRGGVGVTSIATHLARYLTSNTHRRVAYVDLNLSGGASCTMLGVKCNDGLSEALANAHRLDMQYLERTLVAKDSRLHLLAAEQSFGASSLAQQASLAPNLGRVLELLCNSFHYVFLDAGDPGGPLAGAAFDLAKRVYLVADRTVHSAQRALRVLRYVEDRDNNPQTSVLLNSANAALSGKVRVADFTDAIGRNPLHEIAFEPKALQIAENLAEPVNDKAGNGFLAAIEKIADDLTGQVSAPERSWLRGLARWRR